MRRFTVDAGKFWNDARSTGSAARREAADNAALIRGVLNDDAGPRRDVTVINAAAALVVSGLAENFQEGARLAAGAISSGAAQAKVGGAS